MARDRLRPRPRGHRHGLGQGRHRRAAAGSGCASACCSRRVAIVLVIADPDRSPARGLRAERSGQAQQDLHAHRRRRQRRAGRRRRGSQVDRPRWPAIGEVDEANTRDRRGHCRAVERRRSARRCGRIQNELFDLGADLATPRRRLRAAKCAAHRRRAQVDRLEDEIDAMNAALEPLTSFILPGGSAAVAALHLARSVVRRAERAAVALARSRAAQSAGARLSEPPVRSSVRRSRGMSRQSRRRRRAVATRRNAQADLGASSLARAAARRRAR